MRKILVLMSWAMLYTNLTQAQLNESDTLKFQLKASLSGNYQTGNVNILTLRGKLDAVWMLSKNLVFKSQNSQLYQSFFSKKADSDLFSRNYLYYQPHHRIYPYGIAYLSTNYRRKVDSRYFAGAGITYQLIRNEQSSLKLSANAIYEQSRFSATTFNDAFYNGSDQIKLWRASLFMMGSSWLFSRRVRLYYDAYWQPAFKRSNNYRSQVDAGIEFPLWRGLGFTALYTYTHENVVPLTTKTTDNILTFGLNFGMRSGKKN